MALTCPGILSQSQIARMYSSTPTATNIVIELAIDNAINVAIGNGLFTCTYSVSGKSAIDIQNSMNMLKQLGYTATLSGTTLTISW
jgi:hypothetical protein